MCAMASHIQYEVEIMAIVPRKEQKVGTHYTVRAAMKAAPTFTPVRRKDSGRRYRECLLLHREEIRTL